MGTTLLTHWSKHITLSFGLKWTLQIIDRPFIIIFLRKFPQVSKVHPGLLRMEGGEIILGCWSDNIKNAWVSISHDLLEEDSFWWRMVAQEALAGWAVYKPLLLLASIPDLELPSRVAYLTEGCLLLPSSQVMSVLSASENWALLHWSLIQIEPFPRSGARQKQGICSCWHHLIFIFPWCIDTDIFWNGFRLQKKRAKGRWFCAW